MIDGCSASAATSELTATAIAAGVALIGVPSLRHHQQYGIALTVALCLPLGCGAATRERCSRWSRWCCWCSG